MINARTWHWLCLSGYMMFPGTIAIWLLPKNSPFATLALVAVGWGMLVGFAGGVMGLLFAFRRLKMGCPRCGARSRVTGGNRDGMCLDCPSCGELRIKPGRLLGLTVIKERSVEDDLVGYDPKPSGALKAPLRYPLWFAILFLPVVISVIVSSILYKFTFYYLFIPGFWCYAVGGLLIDAIGTGWISDNHGTASKAKSPFRFWSKVLIWFLAYLFATAFPIGLAIQERNSANARNVETGVPQSVAPASK